MSADSCVSITPADLELFAQGLAVLVVLLSFLASFVGHAVSSFLDRMAWRAMRRKQDKRRMVTM